MRYLLLFAALLAAPSVTAQASDSLTSGVQVHSLPFGSSGNAIELTVGALLRDAPDSVEAEGGCVVVVNAPDWLRFSDPAVPAQATDDGENRALLSFDVDREAPVAKAAAIVLDVLCAGVPVATKSITVQVEAPEAFGVRLPRPNPTGGAVTVPYDLPVSSHVEAVVYDLLGRRVLSVDEGEQPAGAHEVRLDARALAAGTYAVVVTAGDVGSGARAVQRLIVVR